MIYYAGPRWPNCTYRINIKKYYDFEEQKWIRDKLEKIRSYSLGDIIDDNDHNVPVKNSGPNYYYEQWFFHKDNDLDSNEYFENY